MREFMYDVDLARPLHRILDGDPLAMHDNKANRFGANVFIDGQAADLTGYTAKGYYIRLSTETIELDGVINGNQVVVDLKESCYLYDGSYVFTLKILKGETEITLYIVSGRVLKTDTYIPADDTELVSVKKIQSEIGNLSELETTDKTNLVKAINEVFLTGGVPGEDGATFTPHVDETGNLSWSNDKNLDNPPSVNIKGGKGDKGDKGDTPQKGVDYFTSSDKTEIVNAVLNEIPDTPGGESSIPVNHASENETYGIGTNEQYGHLKNGNLYSLLIPGDESQGQDPNGFYTQDGVLVEEPETYLNGIAASMWVLSVIYNMISVVFNEYDNELYEITSLLYSHSQQIRKLEQDVAALTGGS